MLAELRSIVGQSNALANAAVRAAYAGDGSLEEGLPAVVVVPDRVEQVADVLRLAARWGLPVVPRGAGTGLSGGAVAKEGGILLTLTRLNHIKRIDPENRLAVVEPGVVNAELTRAAAPYGLYYAPDPSSQPACTIGGNVAENSGGAHCLANGVTTNHILGLEALVGPEAFIRYVSAGGRPAGLRSPGAAGRLRRDAGRRHRGDGAPDDPRRVDRHRAGACSTPPGRPSETVSAIIAAGIIPAALEMMDGMSARAVEQGLNVGFPLDAGAVLLIELEGVREAFADDPRGELQVVLEHCRAHGARSVRTATAAAERDLLWKGRKAARGALGRLAPNYYVHDGVVPRSRIPEVIDRIAVIAEEFGLPVATYLPRRRRQPASERPLRRPATGRSCPRQGGGGGHSQGLHRPGGRPLRGARHRAGEAGLPPLAARAGRPAGAGGDETGLGRHRAAQPRQDLPHPGVLR